MGAHVKFQVDICQALITKIIKSQPVSIDLVNRWFVHYHRGAVEEAFFICACVYCSKTHFENRQVVINVSCLDACT